MSSEFKQQLKIQMHARQVVSFDSWAQYLKFVTSVQRAVQPDGDSSSDIATIVVARCGIFVGGTTRERVTRRERPREQHIAMVWGVPGAA